MSQVELVEGFTGGADCDQTWVDALAASGVGGVDVPVEHDGVDVSGFVRCQEFVDCPDRYLRYD